MTLRIEGNPFIIRFKTIMILEVRIFYMCIEGNPFIIRFKTFPTMYYRDVEIDIVLKVIHL